MLKNKILLVIFLYMSINKTMKEEEALGTYSKFKEIIAELVINKKEKEKNLSEDYFIDICESINKLNELSNNLKKKEEEKKLFVNRLENNNAGMISLEKIKEAQLIYDIIFPLFTANVSLELILILSPFSSEEGAIKNIITFLNINQYNNPKNIICIGLGAYILWIIMQHYKSIKGFKTNKDLNEIIGNIDSIDKEINAIKKSLIEHEEKIKKLNDLIGVKVTQLIIELTQSFKSKGENITWLEAIIETESYKNARKEGTLYEFYQLISSSLLTKNEDKTDKEIIQKSMQIREHVSIDYRKGSIYNSNEEKLYGNIVNIIDEISRNIIEYFKSSDKKNSKYPRYCFYGPPGTGKTKIVNHIIAKVIHELDITFFQIKNSDIQHDNDIKSLETQINLLLNDNKQVIIFIDEADGIFKKRDQSKDDEKNDKIITEMLQFVDRCCNRNLAVFMNTNYKDKLDEALIRASRFHTYKMSLPDYNERYMIALQMFFDNPKLIKTLFQYDINKNDKLSFVKKEVYKLFDQTGALDRKKRETLNIMAAHVSLFTVNDSQATIVNKVRIFNDLLINRYTLNQTIEDTVTLFFTKIHSHYFQEKKIHPNKIWDFMQTIESKQWGNNRKQMNCILTLSKQEDKKYNIISKENFFLTAKNYSLFVDLESLFSSINEMTEEEMDMTGREVEQQARVMEDI